jgi:hypothetical protein
MTDSEASPAGAPDQFQDAVQDATAQAEDAKAKAAAPVDVPPKQSKAPILLAVCAVIFLCSLTWSLGRMADPVAAPPAKVLVFGAKAHLEEARLAVDRFRAKVGTLPKKVTDATGGEDLGVTYKALGTDDYELSVETAGQTIRLKGSDDLEAFFASSPAK